MMVVGHQDLGLSLSLPSTTTTTTHNQTQTHNKNNMAFMMMIKGNNNTTHHHHHQQTTPSTSNIINNSTSSSSPAAPLHLNLMTTPSSTSTPPSLPFLKCADRNSDPSKSFLRRIDINRAACGGDDDEEPGVSSPNSTVSTLSGKRSSPELSEEENGGDNSRKKLRLSKDQSAILEDSFKQHNTLNPKQKLALAKRLELRPRQVEVWFQNRRARTKLKQTEVDCEFLKRCCEQLTEENRRLQKEVHELRALKMSPHFYMHMTPPTTLTICPSCDRPDPARIRLQAHPPADAH